MGIVLQKSVMAPLKIHLAFIRSIDFFAGAFMINYQDIE